MITSILLVLMLVAIVGDGDGDSEELLLEELSLCDRVLDLGVPIEFKKITIESIFLK